MPIRITSKKNGFRRCGIEHPDKPTMYPDKKFSKEQLEILKGEPMLIVEEIPDSGTSNSGKDNLNPVGSLNAKDAIKQIEKLSWDELHQVIATDERTTVQQAATNQIIHLENSKKFEELEKQLTEAQQLPDGPEKEKTVFDLTKAIESLTGQ